MLSFLRLYTALDAGTRACRFILQDLAKAIVPALSYKPSWFNNFIFTIIVVAAWGFFVYQGVLDPLGGVNTLWPLFGIGNQMLAGLALLLGTVVIIKMKKQRYSWISFIPTMGVMIICMIAGWEKIFSPNPSVGFLAQARQVSISLAEGRILDFAHSPEDMQTIILSNYIDAALCGFFMLVAAIMIIASIVKIIHAFKNPVPTMKESPIIWREKSMNF